MFIIIFCSCAIDLDKSNVPKVSVFSDGEGEIADSSSDEDVRYNFTV